MPDNRIPDPADLVANEADVQALFNRYAGTVPALRTIDNDDFAERFANVCDLVVQLLWADRYGTGPSDPHLHTSDPARRIAGLIMNAAGIE